MADGADRERGTRQRDETDGAQPEQSTQVLQLEHDRIARVLLQIPYGTQALPHRADPVDARDQQRETGDEPDGAGVVGEGAQIELLGDARDLAADGVLCGAQTFR
jgi:hypothetical protein